MRASDGLDGGEVTRLNSDRRQYRGLLLDFYGTLVHEDDEIIPPICEVIRAHATVASDVSIQSIAEYWWHAFTTICSRSHGRHFVTQRESTLSSLEATIRRYGAAVEAEDLIAPQFAHWVNPLLFADTRPFLEAIEAARIPVCVVSNIDRYDLQQALAHHGFDFEHVVTSDDVRAYKPRTEMFTAALAKLELGPQDLLHVGDSRTSDVAGARNAGIDVAWLNRNGKTWSGGEFPTYTVSELHDVLKILKTTA